MIDPSRLRQRRAIVLVSVKGLLDDLVIDVDPANLDALAALRQIQNIAGHAVNMLRDLDDPELPVRDEGEGAYAGPVGPVAQTFENAGAQVISELLAMMQMLAKEKTKASSTPRVTVRDVRPELVKAVRALPQGTALFLTSTGLATESAPFGPALTGSMQYAATMVLENAHGALFFLSDGPRLFEVYADGHVDRSTRTWRRVADGAFDIDGMTFVEVKCTADAPSESQP